MTSSGRQGDFSLPRVIEKSSQYQARETRALFEARALSLAKQAFWHEIFELLAAYPEVAGARFTHERKAARMIEMVGEPGAAPKRVAAAQKALSGARGKFTACQADAFRDHARRAVAKGELVTLARRSDVLRRALGPDLSAEIEAERERRELDGEIQTGFGVDGGRRL